VSEAQQVRLLATVRDAGIALALSPDKIRQLIRDGVLPERRIDGSVRTTWDAIRALAEGETSAATK
jgi:hypothetical protein